MKEISIAGDSTTIWELARYYLRVSRAPSRRHSITWFFKIFSRNRERYVRTQRVFTAGLLKYTSQIECFLSEGDRRTDRTTESRKRAARCEIALLWRTRREEGKDKPALLVSCVSLFCRRSLLALCQPYGFFYRPQWRIDAQVLSPGSPCMHALASLRTSYSLSLFTDTHVHIHYSGSKVLRHFFYF